jgi:hypothetical protein
VDASGFERTVLLTPDLGWEVDVFGMPILDTVLRNQQVGSHVALFPRSRLLLGLAERY